MSNFTTTNSTAPPPSPAELPDNSNTSPLAAILCLVALITIPMICYTFFMAMRNLFWRRADAPTAEKIELVCGVKYRKAAAAGSNDQYCPVCLSVFAVGEEIRQLNACVDMWLYSHSNCPVCRAAVPVKRLKRVLSHGEKAANLI